MTKEGLFEKRVAGVEPFSMLDFGENLCGILFFNSCNYRCRILLQCEFGQRACGKSPG